MKTPTWKLIIQTICFDLGKYKKVMMIQFYIALIILNYWILFRIIHIFFTDGSKDGEKNPSTVNVCHFFQFSKRLPNMSSIFTDELEVMHVVSVLRCVESTTKRKTFIIFSDTKSVLQAMLSK